MLTAKVDKYVDTYHSVQNLLQLCKDPEHDFELVQKLLNIANRLNKNSGALDIYHWRKMEISDVGFYPFEYICGLSDDFRELSQELETGQKQASDPDLWRKIYFESLKETVGKFNKRFQEEVGRIIVFILDPDREEFLKYYQDEGWKKDIDEKADFEFLPKVAQNCFRDGARCITYGLDRPAISLAVQALEATVRYFHLRLIPVKTDKNGKVIRFGLGGMANNLSTNPNSQSPYIPESLKDDIAGVAEYRNVLSHGRALSEMITTEKAQKMFDLCWRITRDLIYEMRDYKQTCVILKIHKDFNFDVALATYLYNSSMEMPNISIISPAKKKKSSSGSNGYHQISIETKGFARDQIKYNDIISNTSQGNSLALSTMKAIEPEEGFSKQIKSLVKFSATRSEGFTSFMEQSQEQNIDIADLFYGFHKIFSDPYDVLKETWSMFDKFTQHNSLKPRDEPRLIEQLEQRENFRKIVSTLNP